MNNLTPTPTMTPPPAPVPLTMNFFDALKEVHVGKTIKKLEWNNSDYCLMVNGQLSIFTNGRMHAWKINDGDMLGEDWVVVTQLN